MVRKQTALGHPTRDEVIAALLWGLGNGMMDCGTLHGCDPLDAVDPDGEEAPQPETGAAGDADYWWSGAYRADGNRIVVITAGGDQYLLRVTKSTATYHTVSQ